MTEKVHRDLNVSFSISAVLCWILLFMPSQSMNSFISMKTNEIDPNVRPWIKYFLDPNTFKNLNVESIKHCKYVKSSPSYWCITPSALEQIITSTSRHQPTPQHIQSCTQCHQLSSITLMITDERRCVYRDCMLLIDSWWFCKMSIFPRRIFFEDEAISVVVLFQR